MRSLRVIDRGSSEDLGLQKGHEEIDEDEDGHDPADDVDQVHDGRLLTVSRTE